MGHPQLRNPVEPELDPGGAAAPRVEVQAASVGYRGQERLHGVTFDIGPGLHLLLGPNGAGKTTLFRTLSGVLAPSSGRVLVNGLEPHRTPQAKVHVGLAGHRAALVPGLSVRDNVEYWARVLALPRTVRAERIEAVMHELELDEFADRRAAILSRGQTQRVGMAKALLNQPSVLLLDEPLSGVDPGVSSRLRAQLRGLAAGGRIVLISSHELAELDDMCDDVIVLRAGRVVAHGAPTELRDELLGPGFRVRIRGTSGLVHAITECGYRVNQFDAEDTSGAVEIDVADDEAVRRLVDRLVRNGIGLYEVSAAENALTDIYLSLDERRPS